MTDYWMPYQCFVPSEKHTRSKKETYTVEGYNSICRPFLGRLKRKTKCYSKKHRNAQAFTAVAHAKMEQSTGYTWLAMPKMLLSSQDIDGEWAKRD